ncbi:hypothetical protein [Streptosporangium vulgare]|uniref:Transcriptional regulator n=1 Tax=Streptosporangium vulgare TaxID=46190 RepID=A0ABV5TFL2_9ACTN
MTAAVTGVAVTGVTALLNAGVDTVADRAGAVPFSWTTKIIEDPCGGASREFVLPRLPPRPDGSANGVAASVVENAPDGLHTELVITFQGNSGTAVVLEALHVEMVKRAKPEGVAVERKGDCGGGMTPRSFAVDLDRPRPRVSPVPGESLGSPIPAVDFPFRISDSDPEVFRLTSRTAACDCRWRLVVDWASGGKRGRSVIDAEGEPFRTVGTDALPYYSNDRLRTPHAWSRRR